MQARVVKIGTRGSPLALAQAHQVRDRLMAAHGRPDTAFTVIAIKTSGDRIQDRPLSEVGGKGLFTKELEEALRARTIDMAVHSMKDMATVLPDGLTIAAVLERADVRDVFVSLKYRTLADVPAGAVIGTSSLRRQAQVRRLRPDLSVVPFRGNVETRLKKLADGIADATFLAAAGLDRLGLTHRISSYMDVTQMLPAVAQGAIGVEIRADDTEMAHLLAPLNHQADAICVACERAFLKVLDGSCRTPIAGLARLDGGAIAFHGMILSPDGSRFLEVERQGAAASALQIGEDAAADLLGRAGDAFFRDGV